MYYPESFVVPSTDIVFDRAMIELFRGCPRGLLILSGRPHLSSAAHQVQGSAAQAGRRRCSRTPVTRKSLSSLSTSDYGELSGLTECMLDYCEPRHISLSLPSLRADSFSAELMERVQKTRKSGLTFACEAGTQRLRDVINKNIREEDVLHALRGLPSAAGITSSSYFMMGLPTETYEDLDGISDICKKVAHCWRENTPNVQRGVRITASVSVLCAQATDPVPVGRAGHASSSSARSRRTSRWS